MLGIGGNELVGCLPSTGGNSPAGELFVPSIGEFGGGKLLTLDKAGGSARARASWAWDSFANEVKETGGPPSPDSLEGPWVEGKAAPTAGGKLPPRPGSFPRTIGAGGHAASPS